MSFHFILENEQRNYHPLNYNNLIAKRHKRNLVQFRDSTGKTIATLHDPRNLNDANVTLSKTDDLKRYIEELRNAAMLKRSRLKYEAKEQYQNSRKEPSDLLQNTKENLSRQRGNLPERGKANNLKRIIV